MGLLAALRVLGPEDQPAVSDQVVGQWHRPDRFEFISQISKLLEFVGSAMGWMVRQEALIRLEFAQRDSQRRLVALPVLVGKYWAFPFWKTLFKFPVGRFEVVLDLLDPFVPTFGQRLLGRLKGGPQFIEGRLRIPLEISVRLRLFAFERSA